MNTVVCIKQVVDTEAEKRLQPGDWRLDRTVENILNPYDEYAVEAAIQLKEELGGEVTVLCMGPDAAEDAARKALAMGADKAVLVTDSCARELGRTGHGLRTLAGPRRRSSSTSFYAARCPPTPRPGWCRPPLRSCSTCPCWATRHGSRRPAIP